MATRDLSVNFTAHCTFNFIVSFRRHAATVLVRPARDVPLPSLHGNFCFANSRFTPYTQLLKSIFPFLFHISRLDHNSTHNTFTVFLLLLSNSPPCGALASELFDPLHAHVYYFFYFNASPITKSIFSFLTRSAVKHYPTCPAVRLRIAITFCFSTITHNASVCAQTDNRPLANSVTDHCLGRASIEERQPQKPNIESS